jgi:hypothetical protein
MNNLKVCLTFDVDFADYVGSGAASQDRGWRQFDELENALSGLLLRWRDRRNWKATWFIRLDGGIENLYGASDFIFKRYAKELDELSRAGHEIGWHPHSYAKSNGQWKQNIDVPTLVNELERYAPLAKSYGLQAVRMGWGFHTNETMHLLADLGFTIDSSAIPRPRYEWEETVKDWTVTPNYPYFPSEADYRVPGHPRLPIIEVPISVTSVVAPYDSGPVLRYINPAYHSTLFRGPLGNWLKQHSHLVTITHPYELVPKPEPHALLSFSLTAFEQNLCAIEELAHTQGVSVSFVTISTFADIGKQSYAESKSTDT